MHDGERVVKISEKTANITTWFFFKSLMFSDSHLSGAEMVDFLKLKLEEKMTAKEYRGIDWDH